MSPPAAERETAEQVLVDTSVAVALLVADHSAHYSTVDRMRGRKLGLAGHASFETFSVLTRLPSPARRTPAAAQRLLAANFPETKYLSPKRAAALGGRLAALAVAGGSVYDALVAAAAEEHLLTLATRDQRALSTYRKFDLVIEILE